MKAITIHQPWATLIALQLKIFETRSWQTKYRGPIAIHAGRTVDADACRREPIRSVLAEHGYTASNLPTGAIIAIATLEGCHEVISVGDYEKIATLYADGIPKVTGNEFEFGWYEQGRFAWQMGDVRKLLEPIPAKGQQGLWNWNPPEERYPIYP